MIFYAVIVIIVKLGEDIFILMYVHFLSVYALIILVGVSRDDFIKLDVS